MSMSKEEFEWALDAISRLDKLEERSKMINDPELRELVKTLLESENRLAESMKRLNDSQSRLVENVSKHVESTGETDKAVANLAKSADRFIATAEAYVKYSQERMVVMEKQLDAIFKSLTINPANGRKLKDE